MEFITNSYKGIKFMTPHRNSTQVVNMTITVRFGVNEYIGAFQFPDNPRRIFCFRFK